MTGRCARTLCPRSHLGSNPAGLGQASNVCFLQASLIFFVVLYLILLFFLCLSVCLSVSHTHPSMHIP